MAKVRRLMHPSSDSSDEAQRILGKGLVIDDWAPASYLKYAAAIGLTVSEIVVRGHTEGPDHGLPRTRSEGDRPDGDTAR
jgi:hypothetical protein